MSPGPQPGKAQPCAAVSRGHVFLPKPIGCGPAWGLLSGGGSAPTQPGGIAACCLFPSLAPLAVSLCLAIRNMLQHPSSAGTREGSFMLLAQGPGTAPRAACSLSVGRMGCRQRRQWGRLAFLASVLGRIQWGRCMRAPMLPSSAHISPHTSAGRAGLHPQKGTQETGLRQRTHPGLWRGLAVDTDTA